MASFLRWLSGAPEQPASPTLTISAPEITTIPPPDSDDDGEKTERENNDEPPAFPALNSAQRANTGIPRILSDTQLMPPPPAPGLAVRQPGVVGSSSLAVPPTTTKAPGQAVQEARQGRARAWA
ncbi:hypothetical protein BDZ89DRAFT_1128891 [Hymenopellis radicata]|nr:hypothetical protein BDZ89DRAFT_1128891 [Hymenopellis radicata]